MRYAILAVSIALAGCVSAEVRSSTESSVIVRASHKTPDDAQVLADASCQKYGKSARLNQYIHANVAWGTYIYDCR